MVSEPSLWFFLCNPVFISIISDSQLLLPLQLLLQPFPVKPLTCFSYRLWLRTCSHHHSESRDHCHTVATVIITPIVFLQVPLRSSSADLPYRGNLTIIGDSTRCHTPQKYSAQKLMRFTRRQTFPRACTCQVFACWRQPQVTSSLPRHLLTSLAQSADVIVDKEVDNVDQTVDLRWLWPLTFLHGWLFLNPGSSCPVFHVDFIFTVCFCILCL